MDETFESEEELLPATTSENERDPGFELPLPAYESKERNPSNDSGEYISPGRSRVEVSEEHLGNHSGDSEEGLGNTSEDSEEGLGNTSGDSEEHQGNHSGDSEEHLSNEGIVNQFAKTKQVLHTGTYTIVHKLLLYQVGANKNVSLANSSQCVDKITLPHMENSIERTFLKIAKQGAC